MTTKPTDTPASDPDSPVDHDVAVVGGGAVGLTAAMFTARYGLETVVFDGGKAAITQCAHVENYLGFPGGISPERFAVETTDREAIADRVVVAAAYDGDVLDPLVAALPTAVDSDDSESEDPFVPTEACRTTVDGLYVAGWMSGETAHQVGVNAGHGARAGLAVARDDMSDRYWPAVGERYVDWVVHDGYFTDRGRDLPPGCEEIGDASARPNPAN